jgi:hypothetical protein
MLPMRSTLATLVVVAALVGCRNQPGTMNNPFLTPDRVPPPSTRVLVPGTAQPYYPGDPLPGAATSPPATLAPPATAYPGAAYPPSSAPLTTPPGGWGAYPPQSQSTLAPSVQQASTEIPLGPTSTSDSIRLSGDQLPLRFPAPQPQTFSSPAPLAAPAAEPITPTPATPPPARMPIQSILPLAGNQPATSSAPATFPPNAGAQAPQQLQIREVTPAEYLAPPQPQVASNSAAGARDGFRPQSPESRDDAESSPSQSFRPPEIRKAAVADAAAVSEYGVGDNYQWLRGQLEYWPAAGQWSLRYLPAGAHADSLGGRVMIDNPQVLANLQAGEFVMVRGQLFSKQTDTGATAPAYRVAVIQRQRL